MKVLLLTTDAYGGHGGIAYYNRCLAEALASLSGVTEVVVVPRTLRFQPTEIPPKVRFVEQACGSKGRYVRSVLGLMREHFDLVICGHINLLSLAAAVAAFKRVPLILQVHGIDAWDSLGSMVRILLRRVDFVWSVSAVTRDRMNSWARIPFDKYVIIPNAIHVDRFGLGPKREDLVDRYHLRGRRILITLARLAGYERYKGIDEILELMPQLLAAIPNLTYMVLGDGSDRGRLESKAKALGLEENVVFAGYIDESEKADYLRLADAFALPGRGEGFGIVYLEAMACGVPVVASTLDGSREALLNGELGELVDPADPGSIREGVLNALSRPKGIPSGLSYFDWPHFRLRIAAAVNSLARP
jgi:glycosyltransferase involved in cell wall biosynthesis